MRCLENKAGKNVSKRKEELQLHMKQKEWLFYASLFLLALFAFLFIGSREPVLFADSESYMKMEPREGLMPAYPFFLLINLPGKTLIYVFSHSAPPFKLAGTCPISIPSYTFQTPHCCTG